MKKMKCCEFDTCQAIGGGADDSSRTLNLGTTQLLGSTGGVCTWTSDDKGTEVQSKLEIHIFILSFVKCVNQVDIASD
jgi:hypothetical protein